MRSVSLGLFALFLLGLAGCGSQSSGQKSVPFFIGQWKSTSNDFLQFGPPDAEGEGEFQQFNPIKNAQTGTIEPGEVAVKTTYKLLNSDDFGDLLTLEMAEKEKEPPQKYEIILQSDRKSAKFLKYPAKGAPQESKLERVTSPTSP